MRRFAYTCHLCSNVGVSALDRASDASKRNDRTARKERRRLRRAFREARRSLDPCSQLAHAQAVARHLVCSPILLRRSCVGLYLGNDADGELDTAPLLARLWSRRQRIGLPVVTGKDMAFYEYRPHTRLVTNRFEIAEPRPGTPHLDPRAMSVMCVPLVAFDDAGTRLGMGGGYYDRLLGALPRALRPRLVGLAHDVQHSATLLPCSEWDIPLDDVVTEAGWRSFRQTA